MITTTLTRRVRAPGASRSAMARRLSKMLKKQVDALEADEAEGFSEARVKALMLLAKTLQAMEAIEEKSGKPDAEPSDADDILEFRRRLESQLQALDGEREPHPLP